MDTRLVCVNPGCSAAGYTTTARSCRTCGWATHSTDEPGLVVPAPKPQPQPEPQSVPATGNLERVGDIGSRVFYGGFWVVVAALGIIGGFAALTKGDSVGFAAIGIGLLAALYARYIIKGGRVRIMFW